jgi:hypothetical protein
MAVASRQEKQMSAHSDVSCGSLSVVGDNRNDRCPPRADGCLIVHPPAAHCGVTEARMRW